MHCRIPDGFYMLATGNERQRMVYKTLLLYRGSILLGEIEIPATALHGHRKRPGR
jgi:hypothetical protein